MLQRLREIWLPRLLFVSTTAAALGLLLTVLVAPWLDEGPHECTGADPRALELELLDVFARDEVVRRTAVVSGLGLFVTACVFFRPAPPEESQPELRPPPDNIMGA